MRKGTHLSKKSRKKISNALKGRSVWNKGKKIPEKYGKNHPLWKGNEAGYRAKHNRIVARKGRATKCIFCEKDMGRIHWANIDHKYTDNPDDYIALCPKCHGVYDVLNNLRKHKF